MLSLTHPFGDTYIECPLLQLRPAVRSQLCLFQRQSTGRTLVGIFEIDQDLGVGVFAARIELAPRLTGITAANVAMPEQALKKITELRGIHIGKSTAMKLEALIPVRWRMKLLPCLPVGTKLVVGNTLFRVL